ncbi:MAG: enolase C-terminal domain-like protein [Polyangiaceae bacterium]
MTAGTRTHARANVERLEVAAYKIPTEKPESDGTLEWDSTTLVVVELASEGLRAVGYTYANVATAKLVEEKLAPIVRGSDAMQIEATWGKMVAAIRNLGRGGITSMAIAAVDTALWDLKARLLDLPLYQLLGAPRDRVPLYGSGGFTSYSIEELQRQLAGWVGSGIPRVKMKVGRDPENDVKRVNAARNAIGNDAKLFVDANGAYCVKQAIEFSRRFAELDVSWYEEPVYHRDIAGNRIVREHVPPSMEVSNGEYGYSPHDFVELIDGGACDVLQGDVTRCEGITGFLMADALCTARNIPFSTHCAPAITAHPAAAAKQLRHLEYFHDHVRIEEMLFEGLPPIRQGEFDLTSSGPGNGLIFNRRIAEQFKQ